MFKLKTSKANCPTCNDHGYIQLLLGGSETCLECRGSKKWNTPTTHKQVNIKLVQLKSLT